MTRIGDVLVILQAGGQGERIRSVSGSTPKPLLTVAGMPMVERLLNQILACGFRNVTVVVRGRDLELKHRLEQLKPPDTARLRVHSEETPLGNAGILGELEMTRCPALLCFADLVTDMDFATLVRIHFERGCDITLASHHEYHRLTLGELEVNGDDVRRYCEKPTKQFLICSGVVALEPVVIDVARQLPRPFGLSDLVNAALDARCTVTHWLHRSFWIDVNTPELLERARNHVDGKAV